MSKTVGTLSSCPSFLRSQSLLEHNRSPISFAVGSSGSYTLMLASKRTLKIQAGTEGFTKPTAASPHGEDNGGSSSPESILDYPISIQLQPIVSEAQFDSIVMESQQVGDALVIIWMATWCRKCIYLKPKLEKLAAEYYPRIRFYCIDVNAVPHKLVARAGVTKMPIIQVWKDNKKQAEVIGGHKAFLVVNEVREMIENECIQ